MAHPPLAENLTDIYECELFFLLVGRLGFEPRYAVPETAVLPLDDLPNLRNELFRFFQNQSQEQYYFLFLSKKRTRLPRGKPGSIKNKIIN